MAVSTQAQIEGYLQADRPDLARELIRSELTRDPASPHLHLSLARAELRLGDLAAAETHSRTAIAHPETAAAGWHVLSSALQSQPKRQQEAVDAGTHAVGLEPQYWGYRVGLAQAFTAAGRKQDALQAAQIAAQVAGGDPAHQATAMMTLAYAEADLGAGRHGLRTAAAALAVDPTDAVLQESFLRVQARAGHLVQGLSTALSVLRASPTNQLPVVFARLALYAIEHRILLTLIPVVFLVPMIALAIPSAVVDLDAVGSTYPPVLHVLIRVGALLGLAGVGLVLALHLRPVRDAQVRSSLWRFARKSFGSWAVTTVISIVVLCYLAVLLLGPLVFPAVALPFGLILVAAWVHGFAGWFIRATPARKQ